MYTTARQVQPVRAEARPTRRPSPAYPHPKRLLAMLRRHFKTHTASIVGDVAQGELEDAAAGIANTCVMLIPAANSIPALKVLAREVAKRLVREVRAKNRVKALVQHCGPQQSAALLALSVSTFMYHIAQQWGSPLKFEDVVTLLLEHIPTVTAFIAGKSVDLQPLLQHLQRAKLPRRR